MRLLELHELEERFHITCDKLEDPEFQARINDKLKELSNYLDAPYSGTLRDARRKLRSFEELWVPILSIKIQIDLLPTRRRI